MKKIMIAGEKYTTRDGQEKVRWHELGVIMTSQAGKEFVLLDPKVNLAGFPREVGKDKLIASIFEETQTQGNAPQTQGQYPPQGQYPTPQATPQNNMDDPNRHNGAGSMNRPAQHQQNQQPMFDQNGDQIPF